MTKLRELMKSKNIEKKTKGMFDFWDIVFMALFILVLPTNVTVAVGFLTLFGFKMMYKVIYYNYIFEKELEREKKIEEMKKKEEQKKIKKGKVKMEI